MAFLQEFCVKGLTNPSGIVFVLEMVEGTSAVDKQTARLEDMPDVLHNLTLTLPTVFYVLHAPFTDSYFVLTEHSFA